MGIVYTPGDISEYIVRETLNPILYPEMTPAGHPSPTSVSIELEKARLPERIANIRILEPACGEGIFLLTAAIYLFGLIDIAQEGRLTNEQRREIRKQIVTTNLFGFDTDERGVKHIRKALGWWAETSDWSALRPEPFSPLGTCDSALENHILVADALGDIQTLPTGFDVVMGNPPYVTMTNIAAEQKNQYATAFSTYHANGDLYYLFLERTFSFLKPGGQLGVIVPRYFLKAPTAERLRGFLATKRCWAIDDLGKTMTFPGVGIHAMLLFFANRPPQAEEKMYLRVHPKPAEDSWFTIGKNFAKIEEFPADGLSNAPWMFLSPAYRQFITQVRSRSQGSLADYCTLAKGVQTGKDAVFVVDDATMVEHKLEPEALRPWLKGRDIHPFMLGVIRPQHVIFSTIHEGDSIQAFPWAFAFLQKHEAELRQRSRVAKWYQWRKGDERVTLDWAHPKIVGRYKATAPMFALDTRGAYFSQDVVLVQPKPAYEKYMLFFLALLNSSVVAQIAENEFKELGYHTYEWYPQQLAKIPVLLPPPEFLVWIDSLMGKVLAAPTQRDLKDQLSEIITTLYKDTD